MTTDRELLELAAKAAGIVGAWDEEANCLVPESGAIFWNPLTDDANAFRLAVKLRLSVKNTEIRASVLSERGGTTEPHGTNPYAATRRAITRAAAEIGRGMP